MTDKKETITIELPAEISFTRAGQVFTVAAGNFNSNIVKELAIHGMVQKIGDAAAGKSDAAALEAMQAVYTRLSNGEWTGRKAGGPADPYGAYRKHIRDIMRPAVKEAKGAATIETIDDAFADMEADESKAEQVAAILRTAKARAKALDELSINIEL